MATKKIIAAGGLVLNEKEELLMIFRRGKWDLPKGKLDKNESIPSCALREVEEETGVQNLQLGRFLGCTTHKYFDEHRDKKVVKETHWYTMYASSTSSLVPQLEEDITAIEWVALDKVAEKGKQSYKNITDIINIMLQNSLLNT